MSSRCTPLAQGLSFISQSTRSLANPEKLKGKSIKPEDVYKHFSKPAVKLSPITSTFSCMDFKGQRPIIGTPGGDFGEFLLAYSVMLDIDKRGTPSYEVVKENLAMFIWKHCSVERPFYKHTDAYRIGMLQARLEVKEFPKSRPSNLAEWFSALIDPEMHGCGHLRSILTDTAPYRVKRELVENVLCSFYDLRWDPKYHDKTMLEVLAHPEEFNRESGLVIHTHSCSSSPNHCDAFTPYKDGQGLFSVNMTSQQVFREQITVPFFSGLLEGAQVSATDFRDRINERAFEYWKATGGFLHIPDLPLIEIQQEGYVM